MEWQLPWRSGLKTQGNFEKGIWFLSNDDTTSAHTLSKQWKVKFLSAHWLYQHKWHINQSVRSCNARFIAGYLANFPREELNHYEMAKHSSAWIVNHPNIHQAISWDAFFKNVNTSYESKSLAKSLINLLTLDSCDHESVKGILQWYCINRSQMKTLASSGLPCTLHIVEVKNKKIPSKIFYEPSTPIGKPPVNQTIQLPVTMPLIPRQVIIDFWATLLQLQSRPSQKGDWRLADDHSRTMCKALILAQLNYKTRRPKTAIKKSTQASRIECKPSQKIKPTDGRKPDQSGSARVDIYV